MLLFTQKREEGKEDDISDFRRRGVAEGASMCRARDVHHAVPAP